MSIFKIFKQRLNRVSLYAKYNDTSDLDAEFSAQQILFKSYLYTVNCTFFRKEKLVSYVKQLFLADPVNA